MLIKYREVSSGRSRFVYTNQETHFDFPLVFLAKQSKEDLYIEAGEYSYPFQIVIPPNMPTSFEHYLGRTKYSVNATLYIPWYF